MTNRRQAIKNLFTGTIGVLGLRAAEGKPTENNLVTVNLLRIQAEYKETVLITNDPFRSFQAIAKVSPWEERRIIVWIHNDFPINLNFDNMLEDPSDEIFPYRNLKPEWELQITGVKDSDRFLFNDRITVDTATGGKISIKKIYHKEDYENKI